MPKKFHSKNNIENQRSHPVSWTVSRAAMFVLCKTVTNQEEGSQSAKIRPARAKKLTGKSSSEKFGHSRSELRLVIEFRDSDSA
jgi:hypothetical protein